MDPWQERPCAAMHVLTTGVAASWCFRLQLVLTPRYAGRVTLARSIGAGMASSDEVAPWDFCSERRSHWFTSSSRARSGPSGNSLGSRLKAMGQHQSCDVYQGSCGFCVASTSRGEGLCDHECPTDRSTFWVFLSTVPQNLEVQYFGRKEHIPCLEMLIPSASR